MDAGVVQEGQHGAAERGGGSVIVHHGHLDPLRLSSHTQADQRNLDDGQ